MAISVVQRASTAEGGTTSQTVGFTNPTTAGNTLVILIQLYSQGGGTNESDLASMNPITDGGDTFTLIPAAEVKRTATHWYQHQYVAIAQNIRGQNTLQSGSVYNTITVEFASSTWSWLAAWEITPAAFDQAITNTATGGQSFTVGSITPSAAGSFLIMGSECDGQPGWNSPPSGWTVDIQTGAGGGQNSAQDYEQGAISTVNCSVNASGTNGAMQWSGTAVSFIPDTNAYENYMQLLKPVAWWKLNEAEGSSTVADSSGNGSTGAVNEYVTQLNLGAAGPGLTGLPDTSAEGFQNYDPNISFTASSPLLAALQNHDFTYIAWGICSGIFYNNTYEWMQFSVGSESPGGIGNGSGFGATFWGGNGGIYGVDNGYSATPSSGPEGITHPDFTEWHLFGLVYNSSTQKFTGYIDGVNKGQFGPMTINVSGSSGQIGISTWLTSNQAWTNGSLCQVAVCNYQLSNGQFSDLYTAASTGSTLTSLSPEFTTGGFLAAT